MYILIVRSERNAKRPSSSLSPHCPRHPRFRPMRRVFRRITLSRSQLPRLVACLPLVPFLPGEIDHPRWNIHFRGALRTVVVDIGAKAKAVQMKCKSEDASWSRNGRSLDFRSPSPSIRAYHTTGRLRSGQCPDLEAVSPAKLGLLHRRRRKCPSLDF